MHFHNGHSKLIHANVFPVCGGAKQSLHYMYSRGFKQRSRLYELVHPHAVLPVQLTVWRIKVQTCSTVAVLQEDAQSSNDL